jgi:dienelactone hydrolase
MTPGFILEGDTPLVDEPPPLRLSGVKRASRVTLHAFCIDSSKVPYKSWANYKSGSTTTVDPARQRSLDGTYKGRDPFGLWWSMASVPERAFSRDLRPIATNVSAEIDGERIVEVEFERLRVAAGVRARDVRCEGLVATFFVPGGQRPKPAIIVFGGSEGGIALAEELAALLASHGFAALAVAYFGADGLPSRLVQIPLEYGKNAARWLLRQPETAGPGLGVLGTSRGGELALLLASLFPKVQAVVGFAASSVIWPGFTMGLDCQAAWTHEDKDVPFAVPRMRSLPPTAAGPLVSGPWFVSALRDQRTCTRAMIPVERIRGAILLISGGDDKVWPSHLLAELAMQRIDRRGGARATRGLHLTYPRAGHGVGRSPGLPAAPTVVTGQNGISYALGGSKAGNARSAQLAWPQVISFFSQHLAASATVAGRRKGQT